MSLKIKRRYFHVSAFEATELKKYELSSTEQITGHLQDKHEVKKNPTDHYYSLVQSSNFVAGYHPTTFV